MPRKFSFPFTIGDIVEVVESPFKPVPVGTIGKVVKISRPTRNSKADPEFPYDVRIPGVIFEDPVDGPSDIWPFDEHEIKKVDDDEP